MAVLLCSSFLLYGCGLFSSDSDATKGDQITFQSYIDLLISVSLCPTIHNKTETDSNYNLETKDPDYHYDFIDRVNSIKISVNPNKLPYQVYE